MSKTSLRTDNTLEVMERLFSRKFGLAKSVYGENRLRNLSVPTVNSRYTVGNIIPMFRFIVDKSKDTYSGLTGGGGASLNRDKSKIKAFGEFIERYCSVYDENEYSGRVICDSYENLIAKGLSCLDLGDLISFEDSQYDDPEFLFAKYSTHARISWIEGKELTCGKNVWLPAQKVFLSYPKNELWYNILISTGLACGSDFYQAALGAIYEVIERDSFMLTWFLKIPGIRIEMDDIRNEELRTLYNHICKHLVGEDRLFIYDISKTDGVYTILTFIRNDLPDAYGLIVSAASHTSPEIALLKSLEELCQVQGTAYHNLVLDEKKECQRLEKQEVDTLHKHYLYYSTGRHSRNIDFISASNESIRLSEMVDYSNISNKDNLEYVVHLFRENNQLLYLADITKPEIRMSGFLVLRAIIPGYVDLATNHCFMYPKSSRLQQYQKKYGSELNDNPHPFP